MNLIDMILLGLALGVDCLIASFSQGLIFKSDRIKNSLSLAVIMGLFQGGMPIIGYIGTNYIYAYVTRFDKWIVFAIFLALGIKFITEAFNKKENQIQCIGLKCLLGLGFATSIDALVAGASIRLTGTNLFLSVLIIGLCSFLMSTTGFWSGNTIKHIPSKYLEILGGIILILLASKALI